MGLSHHLLRLDGHFGLFDRWLILSAANLGHQLLARDLRFRVFTRHFVSIQWYFVSRLFLWWNLCSLWRWFELSHHCSLDYFDSTADRVLPFSCPSRPLCLLFDILESTVRTTEIVCLLLLFMLIITADELIDKFVYSRSWRSLFLIFLFAVIIWCYLWHLWTQRLLLLFIVGSCYKMRTQFLCMEFLKVIAWVLVVQHRDPFINELLIVEWALLYDLFSAFAVFIDFCQILIQIPCVFVAWFALFAINLSDFTFPFWLSVISLIASHWLKSSFLLIDWCLRQVGISLSISCNFDLTIRSFIHRFAVTAVISIWVDRCRLLNLSRSACI